MSYPTVNGSEFANKPPFSKKSSSGGYIRSVRPTFLIASSDLLNRTTPPDMLFGFRTTDPG